MQTETLEARCLLAAGVVISEIMYHPRSGDVQEEWIELFNAGADPLDLGGATISRGVDFSFPELTLQPGGYLVVAADVPTFQANYGTSIDVVGGWQGRLSNSANEVVIDDRLGNRIDGVAYADSGDWALRRPGPLDRGQRGWIWEARHDGGGRSLELMNPLLENDYAHNWQSSQIDGGTPGGINSATALDIAPAVTDVAHAPIVPDVTDDVTVTARFADEDPGGVTGSLFWRVNTLDPGGFDEVPMLDDGLHGDGRAGDGIYGASIPAQPHQTVVEFYVRAVDSGGRARTSPGPTDTSGTQGANMLYQVDQNQQRLADVPRYRSIMTAADWETFRTMDRDSNAQMNATFVATVGGITEVRYNVGIRYRGSGTRSQTPTNNRINIPSDRPWFGDTEININASRPDNQIGGSALFALAGLPAADGVAVRMMHNGTNLAMRDNYVHLEVLNSDWAARHFPLDGAGNVYRGRRAGEGPPGGFGAGLEYFGEEPGPYASYLKGSNGSERDWSDVIRLTDVLNNAPDETYIEQLEQVVNVDEWLRAIAMIVLTGYAENGLLTGDAGGDDYAMYRGIGDPRFLMVPYDLDAMFASTPGSLFRTDDVPALQRLLNHPQIVPRYYAQLMDLIDNVLTEERVRPFLEPLLVLAPTRVDAILSYLERSGNSVRTRIQTELTAASDLPLMGGVPHTTGATSGPLHGTANALTTRSVRVAGHEAAWDARHGNWSIAEVPLLPGVNRLLVQTLDDEGWEIDRTFVDVWRDTGSARDVTDSISADTVWTAEEGPYRVSGELTVAENATLTIMPGTSVYFDAGASLVVRGRLLAEGTDQSRIRFTRIPNTNSQWDGIQLVDTVAENRIHFAVLEYGVTENGMIGVNNSHAELDHLWLDHSNLRRIRAVNASMTVRNSTFTDVFGPDQSPTTDNLSEQINGSGILEGGQLVIEGNTFGTTKGHNDVIDFNSPTRPNPILQILNNTFAGSGDEILDLGGDAYIEGNLFQHVHKDQFNQGTGEANAISTGDSGLNTVITVVRNVFQDVDYAVYLKRNTFMFFENNTVVGIPDDTEDVEYSAINFVIPRRDSPGKGAYLNGNIFQDIPRRIFGHVDEGFFSGATDLEMHNTLLSPERAEDRVGERDGTIIDLGTGNIAADPRLDTLAGGFRLRPGSPAIGSGPNGIDMGAAVPAGASISGEPPHVTGSTSATLRVAGPGITHYRFRLNNGPWSSIMPVGTPIELADLEDGAYQVAVIGQNFAGVWQEESEAAVSRAWTVDRARSLLQISEILAGNRETFEHAGTFPDLVELTNAGGSTVDLAGIRMTDDMADPDRFVFPDGLSLAPGDRIVLYADRQFSAPGIHLGFSLDSEGESLFLYDRPAQGGGLLDSIQFGLQVPDQSLGRMDDGRWALAQPTFGGPNLPARLGDTTSLRINEWLADAEVVLPDEFIEIHNPDPLPVELSGMFLTDSPSGWPDRYQIAPYSYIAGSAFAIFDSDENAASGSNHVQFRLSRQRGMIGLLSPNLDLVDQVRYPQQFPDISLGMLPDGSPEIASFLLPSPGLSNTDDTFHPLWNGLRITEIMYNPIGGTDYEFIELQNTGDETLGLAGVRLSEGIDFTFSNMELAPGELVVIVNNLNAFQSRYGTGIRIAGEFSGNLSNGGERVRLRLPDPHPANIQDFRYDDAWYPSTDGTGFALVSDSPPGVRDDWSQASAWRPSSFLNGSPGAADSSQDAGAIVVNEVLANTFEPSGAQIELKNTSDTTLDISGWYLSDDPDDLTKFQIPAGAVLPAGEFIVFSEKSDFGTALDVPRHGGQIWLASPDAIGNLAGISAGVSYSAVDAEVTLGRYVRSDNSAVFVEQLANTLRMENAGPAVGPVVIHEVMYHPPEGGDEFIELSNIGDQEVLLYDPVRPNNTWQLSGSVEYSFPTGVEIVPGGLLLITGIDPVTFRSRHAIPAEVPILGPFSGELGDDGGDVGIVRPGVPDGPFVPAIWVDRVRYDDQAPWPVEADGGKSSLNRSHADHYGDDAVNWEPSLVDGTPGLPNLPFDGSAASVPVDLVVSARSGPAIALSWPASVDPESGIDAYRVYRNGQLIASVPAPQYEDVDVEPLTTYVYEVSAVNRQGLESMRSVATEIHLMSIESVTARFADEVIVRFSEPVDTASAVPENFEVDGIEIISLALAQDGLSLTLATSVLSPGTPYQLTIGMLTGVSGNPLAPQSVVPFEMVPAVPGFTIRGMETTGSIVASIPDANALRLLPIGGPGIALDRTFNYQAINFIDDDSHQPFGMFDGDRPFPTDHPGDDDDLVVFAEGTIIVPPGGGGPWTFAVVVAPAPDSVESQQSEDGFRLRINRTRTLFASGQHGPGLRLATVTLAEGRHFMDFLAYERTNWSEFELVAAPGTFSTLDATDTWRLVGDTAGGGLAVFTDPLRPEPITWDRVLPAGSLVFEQAREYEVNGPETVVIQTAWLPADQPLSLVAAPIDTSAALSLKLRNESGGILYHETAPGAGRPVTLANIQVPAEGTYLIELSSDIPVRAQLRATLGALIETELFTAEEPNDEIAGAQQIDASYFDLGQGVVRGAVLGEISGTELLQSSADNVAGGQVLSFEFPDLPLLDDGAILLITATADLDGTDEFLTLLGLDGSGLTVLSEDLFRLDGRASMPVTTAIDLTADQLRALSVDGTVSFTVTPSDAVGRLEDTALSLALRFGETSDTYRLSLVAAETVDVTATGRDRGPLSLVLLDPAGHRIGLGSGAAGSTAIRDFVVPASGDYLVQVSGAPGNPYSLIVTRNSGLDALPNDRPDRAQNISLHGSVLGAIGGAPLAGDAPSGPTVPVTLPVFLNDAEGFQWDIQFDGSISDGTSDAFDGGLRLLNFPGIIDAESEDGGREIVLGPSGVAGSSDLHITRKIYIPAEQSFARFLEIVTNNGNVPQDYVVQLDTNLGSDNTTSIIATSVDDGQFTTEDLWIVTDDGNGTGDPTVTHLVAGPGAQSPTMATVAGDNIGFSYELNLAPGQTQIVMHFALQSNTQEEAINRATALADLQLEALAGMSELELSQLVNFVVADRVDYFSFEVPPDSLLTISTSTPTLGNAVLENDLDPSIELIDPRGVVVSQDDNSADGVNARINYATTLGGTYTVRVASEQGAGEYLLRVTGGNRAATPFSVVGTEPAHGVSLDAVPHTYTLHLSSTVLLDSLDAADLTIDGVVARLVKAIDGRTVQFTFDQPTSPLEGPHVVGLAAGVLTDLAGVANEPFSGSFLVDATPPRVVLTTWNGAPLGESKVLPPGPLTFTATFDEPIDRRVLGMGDIILREDHLGTVYRPFINYDSTTRTLSAFLGQLPEGDYTLTLFSRDDALVDGVGNTLDGEARGAEPDGTISGDGADGGDFAVSFRLDAAPLEADRQFRRLEPFGSLILRAQLEDVVSFEQDVDRFEVFLEEGETLQAVAARSGTSGTLSLVVRDADLNTIESAIAAPTHDVAQTRVAPIAASGRYVVEVTGDTIGQAYSLTLVRNAVVEVVDTSSGLPLSLDPSRIELGLPRYAVVSRSEPKESTDTDTFTLDLTGRQVPYLDILLTGLEDADFSSELLEVLSASGDVLLATGIPYHSDPMQRNFDLGILRFRPPAAEVYTLRVTSAIDADYSLVVTEGAAFDTEPNGTQEESHRNLDGLEGAMGFVGAAVAGELDDPRGDVLATGPVRHDIERIRSSLFEGTLTLALDFYDPIPTGSSGPLLIGYFELDLDENPATGDSAFQNQAFPAGQQGGPLGVEARVIFDSQSTNGAQLYDSQFNFLAAIPLRFDSRSLEVDIPLSVFGAEDGSVHVGSVVFVSPDAASGFELSDGAPNAEFLVTGRTDSTELASDTYQVTLHAGQIVEAVTETALVGPALSPRNPLDPVLRLFGPGGTMLLEDNDSAEDGKNARVRYAATSDGTYRIEVGTEAGGGEYTLRIRVMGAAGVLGRYTFYNNSVFDGNNPLPGPADDAAIDPGKQALFAGETAGWANYTNFVRGINGVIVDLESPAGTPTRADFDFRVGNSDSLAVWRQAPEPSSITLRAGEGVGGSDRVTLIWDDNAIQNEWLEVTVRANATTGLATPDVFYLGNAIGDSGDSVDSAIVDVADELAARTHPRTFLQPAEIDNPFDYNHDGRVNATDEIIARNHATANSSQLRLITVPPDQPSVLESMTLRQRSKRESKRSDPMPPGAVDEVMASGGGEPAPSVPADAVRRTRLRRRGDSADG